MTSHHAQTLPVETILLVIKLVTRQLVHVFQGTLEILKWDVILNVSQIMIVLEIWPVIIMSALIHALVHVPKMQSVKL